MLKEAFLKVETPLAPTSRRKSSIMNANDPLIEKLRKETIKVTQE